MASLQHSFAHCVKTFNTLRAFGKWIMTILLASFVSSKACNQTLKACLAERGMALSWLGEVFPGLASYVWLRCLIASKHACVRVCLLKAIPG